MSKQLNVEKKPNGPAAAAMLAAGIGALTLGLMTVLAEASKAINAFLTWSPPVGPLSGKTGMAVSVYLVAWALLARQFRNREVDFGKFFTYALILIAMGFLLTFPPIYVAFKAH